MNTAPSAVPAPESYATFWEPVASAAPAPPAHTPPADAKDAYLEFVNVTEDAPLRETSNPK
jgi:hypothetical protein